MKANSVRTNRAARAVRWMFRYSRILSAALFVTQLLLAGETHAVNVTLAWNKNPEPDVTGYNIRFGPQGGTPATVVNAGNVTNITVTGLQEGSSYSFYASAYNSAGLESNLSSPVNYTVPIASNNNLAVSWDQTFSDTAVGYAVVYGPLNQTPTRRDVGNTLSTTISNLVRGATYVISVDAYDSTGETVTAYEDVQYTVAASGSLPPVHLLPIDQPPTVALNSPTNGAAFTAPAAIQISATAADDDAVQYVDLFEGTNLLARVSEPPYSFTWNSVAEGSYEITAVAVDTLDQFTQSQPATITVGSGSAGTAPAAPINLTAKFNRTDGRVRLNWSDVSNNEDSFRLERSTDSVNFSMVGTAAANTVIYFDATVQRGQRYYYRVLAVNAAGANASNIASVRTRF
jgi:hypothetical protein